MPARQVRLAVKSTGAQPETHTRDRTNYPGVKPHPIANLVHAQHDNPAPPSPASCTPPEQLLPGRRETEHNANMPKRSPTNRTTQYPPERRQLRPSGVLPGPKERRGSGEPRGVS